MRTKRSISILIAILAIFAVAGSASAASPGTSVIYSSLVSSPLHGNMVSLGAEAYAFNELGNAVTFSATSKNRSLSNVIVTMSSWGCQSGHWTTGDCLTTPGATFQAPITFNVYDATGTTLLASSTKTFAIPYRPSASAKCADGRWYDNALKSCFNGLATNITFAFSGPTLPDSVVFGIAYNTTHYGYNPIGEGASCYTTSAGCGYDSMNIALSTETDVSAGTNTTPGSIWVNRAPTTDWAPYIPAVQIKASR
jgi:hypothetical protein